MSESFATSVALNLVSKLSDLLSAPIGRQFTYVLCYKSYVEDLQNGVEELETTRERVQRSVDEADIDGKPIETDIMNWLKSVKKETEKADNLLKCGQRAKHACFRGWLPNPAVRHPISKELKKMTLVIRELHEQSRGSIFQKVYYENTPIGIVASTISAARSVDNKEDVPESRAKITGDVMKAIVDHKVCVIGVWGAGGVGKSKLLRDVKKRVREERMFDVVVTANVSRNPDLKRIQGEIAYALGLKLMNEETARGRADRLYKRLESDSQKEILIILDDLWDKLELKDVGIPCGDDNRVRYCKLLLTSRNREVLRSDMGSDREFQLNVLEHGEARRLFERILGDRVKDPEFEPWVDGVVKNCGGLPLLIVSLAKRLKHKSLAARRIASTNVDLSIVKSLVEPNVEDLPDPRIRSLFFVCALNSGRISIRDSLVYCMGLGLLEKFNKTIENARDRLISDLKSLQDSSLLLESDDMEEFRIHDIFVGAAISIASMEWNTLVGRKDYGFKEWSEDELRKCTAMSSPWVGIDELPEKLDCPNMRMLLLLEHSPYLTIPESFFESMEKLQVLNLTGLSFTSLPSSMAFLKNLKSLCLDCCHMEDVTVLGMLKGLQFLSLAGSAIIWLPKEIGELTKLRFLDLTGCAELKVIEPGVLGRLVNIEELYMGDSFDQWEAEDEAPRSNASLAELKNMKKLSALYIAIPPSSYLSRDLPFGKLIKHRIQIGDVWDWSGENKESRTLKLKLDSGYLLLEEWMQRCLQRTQDLQLDGLQVGNDSIHDLAIEGFQELKHLHIQNSPSLQYVVHSRENVRHTIFTRLESLFLENLNNLEKICCGYYAPESFSKLKTMEVDNCGDLKNLGPLSMMRIFLQLEEIEIRRCHLMQQIIADAEADEDNQASGNDEILSQLTKLTLSDLPSLGCIWNKNPRRALYFQNLRALKVHNCDNLRFLFSSSMAKALKQIKEIEIVSCKLMEEIMNGQEEESEEATTIDALEFPLLTSLCFEELPNLWTFYYGKYCIYCPSLTRLRISACSKMMTFSSFKGKQQLSTVDTSLQQAVGLINSGSSLPVFFNQKVHFPRLEELALLSLCGLGRIWHNELPEESFYRLASITVRDCKNLSHIFPSTLIEGFRSLKMIEVVKCTSLEALIENIAVDSKKTQNHLVSLVKEVKLWHLPRLNAVVTSSTKVTLSLPSLTNVSLRCCHSLRYLFTNYTAGTLDKLEMLDISGCDNMQEVVAVEEGDDRKLKAVKFSHLRSLKLCSLKSLISFSSGSCAYEFSSLKEFTVEDCKAVKVIVGDASCRKLEGSVPTQQPLLLVEKVGFPSMELMKISHMDNVEKIWLDELPLNAFSKLKMLIVEYCEKLSSIFSSDTILAIFQNLDKLTVTDCGSLEVVFQVQELNMSEAHSTSNFQLRELNLERLPKMKRVWSGHPRVTLTFERLQYLKADKCLNLKSLFPVSVAKSMTQLKQLVVSYSLVEEIIAEEDGGEGDLFFPGLTALILYHLPRLRSFYRNRHTLRWPHLKELRVTHYGKMGSSSLFSGEKVFPCLEQLTLTREDAVMTQYYMFDNLRELTLSCYHDENVTFPSNFLLQRFPNLETLDVDCSSFEEMFPEDAFGHGGATSCGEITNMEKPTSCGEITNMEKPLETLGNLKRLGLNELWYLRRIWKDGSLMVEILKQIEVLSIFRCPSLSIVFPSPTSFHNLTNLQVEHCVVLVHMGTCSAVTSLGHLAHLILRDCGAMEDVVMDDGNGPEKISFPKLEELILDDLPSLESFSPTNCTFRFPSLVRIIVTRCPKLNFFCKGALRTPKLNKVLLYCQDDEGRWEGNLNTTLQNLST